jgi:serine/threonine protein kinase
MIIGNKYEILSKIGEGSFGKIYKGKNIRTNELVAIKVESILKGTKLLKNESIIYQYLSKSKRIQDYGIPQIKWFGLFENNYFMVVNLLGESLECIKKNSNSKTFSLEITISIGIQIIKILEFIHKNGLIHRDIKPDNFLLGREIDINKVYIIDFGFCKKYIQNDGEHIKCNTLSKILGTPNYISINIHELYEPSRRDDMESLGYMLLYFYYGYLPWENINSLEDIKIQKINYITNDNLILTIFKNYFIYIRNLSFEEAPNYNYLINLLQNIK